MLKYIKFVSDDEANVFYLVPLRERDEKSFLVLVYQLTVSQAFGFRWYFRVADMWEQYLRLDRT